MFSQSIRRKIIGIALGLVVLMVATSVLSMLTASRVGHLVNELTNKYVPAYGDLARANVRSLERALALRQIVIAEMQTPPDDATSAERLQTFRTRDAQVVQEADAARKLIASIIEDPSTPSDNVALAQPLALDLTGTGRAQRKTSATSAVRGVAQSRLAARARARAVNAARK